SKSEQQRLVQTTKKRASTKDGFRPDLYLGFLRARAFLRGLNICTNVVWPDLERFRTVELSSFCITFYTSAEQSACLIEGFRDIPPLTPYIVIIAIFRVQYC